MSGAYIAVNHVDFSYEKNIPILNDITFYANAHDSIGLVGANGVGKSTLLKLLVGLVLDFNGSVNISGLSLQKANLSKIRAMTGYVFQDSDSQLFMSTVYDDVAFAPRSYGLSASEVEDRVDYALNLIGISHLKGKQIYKMSGGEKKMASIATILSMMPDIILMDEPSIALDPRNRRQLINILNSFDQLKIIASHDLDLIYDTCERTILMSEGRIICDGLTKDILSDSKLLEENGLELPLSLIKR